MTESSQIAIIGSGSWATALAKIITDAGNRICWYIRNPENRKVMKSFNRNPRYLGSVRFDPEKIIYCDTLDEAVEQSEVLIFAVPTAFLTEWLSPLTLSLENKYIVSAIKGIIPGEDGTVAEYFHSKYKLPFDQIGVISGPCHAEEVALERLSYLTIATKHFEDGRTLAGFLQCRYLRTILSEDIYGIEYAGVLKNIYAIAGGIFYGLGYGDNFQSVLMANAFIEMKRFINNSYPKERDLAQSAFLGDLLVTGYSQFSRNRTFGTMIGKGYSVRSALLEISQIAEGYYAVSGMKKINQAHGIDMPIMDAVYNMLYNGASPVVEAKNLIDKLK